MPMKMIQLSSRMRVTLAAAITAGFCFSSPGFLLTRPVPLRAQEQKVVWSAQERPIADQIGGLRSLPDDARARTTKNLAIQIRQLPVTPNKLRLANSLAMLSTEGDFGHDM